MSASRHSEALYESVWVEFAESLKMQRVFEMNDLGKFDRKTGELWLGAPVLLVLVRIGRALVTGETRRNRTCALSLLWENRIPAHPGPTRIHLEATLRTAAIISLGITVFLEAL